MELLSGSVRWNERPPVQTFEPEPYQVRGISHLIENPSAALFAGMGLGKTAMTLSAVSNHILAGEARAFLIVAPLRVCNLTWPNEIKKWEAFSWMRAVNLRTRAGWNSYLRRDAHIYLANYEMLPKLADKLFRPGQQARGDLAFDGIIWDELSKAKNPSSRRINAMRGFWNSVKFHWGLTGTPTPNGHLDLFAQIRLLDDGARLGRSFSNYQRTYFYTTDYQGYKWGIRPHDKELIEEKLADIVLVLRSSDYLDIPDVFIEDEEVPLPDSAKDIYKKLEKDLYLMLEEDEIEAMNAAVLTNKLLQVTSGAIYTTERSIVPLHDAKLKALKRVAKNANGPMMVCYMYKHEEERIKAAFPKAVLFSSAKNHRAQDEMAHKWNRGEIPMLVVSPQSVGHGLNMQDGGSEICWFSMTWSRELYDQMNARVARKGQQNVTRITRLICPGTMDEAVAEALKTKGDNQAHLLEALRNFKQALDNPLLQ